MGSWPRDPIKYIGHKSSDAFVVDRNRLDIIRAFIYRIDDPDIAMTAKAENVGHFFADEIVNNHLTTVEYARGSAARE